MKNRMEQDENRMLTEEEVFQQEISPEELDEVAGGQATFRNDNNCSSSEHRYIYGGKGFPNCAATVEDGSWCDSNDACMVFAVCYREMKDCNKAWR